MKFLEKAEIPQISFSYGGKPSDELLNGWDREDAVETNHRGELTRRTWVDPSSRLRVAAYIQRFDDLPAIDWVCELENGGDMDSDIIEDILPMDVSVATP